MKFLTIKLAFLASVAVLVVLLVTSCKTSEKSESDALSSGSDEGAIVADGVYEVSSMSGAKSMRVRSAASAGAFASDGTGEAAPPVPGETEEVGIVGQPPPPSPGLLTAGEWNDLEKFDFWTELMNYEDFAKYRELWGFYPDEKVDVSVRNKAGAAVDGADVVLKNDQGEILWKTKSDIFGKAVLWPNLFGGEKGRLKLYVGDSEDAFSGIRPNDRAISVSAETVATDDELDLMFVVDATGSMGDEILFLKEELGDIISTVKSDSSDLETKLSLLFYRDQGDEYVVRDFQFDDDIDKNLKHLENQFADGGGDYPEAVETALEKALDMKWNPNARTKLMFLILDAPPHDADSIRKSLHASAVKAAELGIKIIPVAASGVNKDTEFLMRFLAMSTNGTYVFLTDDSGIGNSHIKPSIGKYDVELLNSLILRLIRKYTFPGFEAAVKADE